MVPVQPEAAREGRLHLLFAQRDLLDSLATAFLLFDADGRLLDCNRAAVELLGRPRDQLEGLTVSDPRWGAVREDGSPFPAAERPTMTTLQTGAPCSRVVVGIDNPGMARRWLANSTYPVIVSGRVTSLVCSLTDITKRVQKERSLNLLTAVNRFTRFATDSLDPLSGLCRALVEHGSYALAWIGAMSSDEDGGIDIAAEAGVAGYLYEGMVSWSESRPSGLGPVGTALRTGCTQVVNELPVESLFEPWRERAVRFGLNSCAAIPFAPGGRRAVLGVYDRHIFAFDERTLEGLEEIAREAEFGVAHVGSMKQLKVALDGTLAAMARMTEIRDPYTAGHQVHVGSLGAAIATQLGLDANLVQLVRYGGNLHDIGKISIPAEILTHPGQLDPLEYEMVKRHTLVGYDVLSQASLPWPIAELARQHHERMDGSGYPYGLAGDEILPPARIIAVADVVEAMAQHRPYRPGIGLDRALTEVAAGAGTLFDTDVVESCRAVLEAGFNFEAGAGSLEG